MHLPISFDDILHFYHYLNVHILIAEGQSLLLINVPIQKAVQQLQIYEVFSLPVPHSNLSAQYKINHKYIGVTYDEAKVVAIRDQYANRQFCRINTPFKPLINPPSCITALYAKNDQTIKEQCFLVISHVPHTLIHNVFTKNLDHSLRPQDTRISYSDYLP